MKIVDLHKNNIGTKECYRLPEGKFLGFEPLAKNISIHVSSKPDSREVTLSLLDLDQEKRTATVQSSDFIDEWFSLNQNNITVGYRLSPEL